MKSSPPELDVSVCIPVFNEEQAIRECVTQLTNMMRGLPYSFEVLVIDDGSRDRSIERIRDLPVRILRHRRNLGGGIARLTGIRHARGRWIVQTDADGTYPVDAIPAMLDLMGRGADMVIGARRRESATDWRWLRIGMKWLLKSAASRLADHDIPDLNSGMRIYHRDTALRYAYLYPRGHSIMSTMTLAFIADGLKVDFVEIDYHVRKGKSSFRPIRDTYNYMVTIIRTVLYFDPLKVMMPWVLVLGALTLVSAARNLYVVSSLGAVPVLLALATLLLFTLSLLSDQFSRISRQIAFQNPAPPYFRDIQEEISRPEIGEAGKLDRKHSSTDV